MISTLTTWRKHITIFRLLYWAVAIATFRHSAIGFSTLEHDNVWLGALAAVAVDIGMLLAAEKLQKERSIWLVLGLSTAAIASVYSQLLYAVANAEAIMVAEGAKWLGHIAQDIIDARVIVIPLLLPLQAVVYSFASKSTEIVEVVSKTEPITNDLEFPAKAETCSLKEQAMALCELHPRLDAKGISETIGCSLTTAYNAIREFGDNGSKPKEKVTT